ncbi:MAG: 4Fe-4S ferredoxin, iron-sulpur binding protein, partial [Sporomusa sp.]|nr:4Fe-4S ferredoxin, iron-sulpur binding protein [Sporomusa sp.]
EFNKKTKKVEKCHMCAARQDKGEKPACVAGCPMEAISVIAVKDDTSGARRSLPGFPDVAITNPTTRFIKPVVGQQVRRDS